MAPTVEYAAPIVVNVFPGRVVSPDGETTDKIRVVLTPDQMVVYGTERTPGGKTKPVTRFIVDYTSARPDGTGGWYVTATDGEWHLKRGPGCGCSSPLKRMPTPLPLHLTI